ncbi:MAG: phosphatidylglycerophosphatase A [Planctomycetia bacterium]|nr:phosphatidylglycerophosphatase A [Planctomycetia bacterium]
MTKSKRDKQKSRESAAENSWAVVLATGFGIGYFRKAPGTWGTLLGLPLAWAIGQLPTTAGQVVSIIAVCWLSVPVATLAGRQLGRGKDPGCIVIDEIASVPITFFLLPMSSPTVVVVGFLLNRLFDITKPPPARQLEHLPEGWGVMADDWAAGVYSNLALRLFVYLAPAWLM